MINVMKLLEDQGGTAGAHYLVGIELRAALRGVSFAYPAPNVRHVDLDGEVVTPIAISINGENDVIRARGEKDVFDSMRPRFSRWTKIEALA